jgi:F-type H+-transporting ATPase subunit b
MDALIQALGINWKSLLAQVVNFGLLFFLLWKFAYPKILKTLQERTARIEKSMQFADEVEKKLREADQEIGSKLKSAQQEALAIVDASRKEAAALRTEELERTKAELGSLRDRHLRDLEREKAEMVAAVRSEATDLVIAAVSQITRQAMTEVVDQELAQQTIADITK